MPVFSMVPLNLFKIKKKKLYLSELTILITCKRKQLIKKSWMLKKHLPHWKYELSNE